MITLQVFNTLSTRVTDTYLYNFIQNDKSKEIKKPPSGGFFISQHILSGNQAYVILPHVQATQVTEKENTSGFASAQCTPQRCDQVHQLIV